MDKNILERIKEVPLTWVFCEMKSGLIFGVCSYDKDNDLTLIEKCKWEEAYLLENKYTALCNFNNSAIDFMRAWISAKVNGEPVQKVKDKYSVISQKDWNKLKKKPIKKDIQIKINC